MKQLRKFLSRVRSYPEEVRKFLALFSMLSAALVLFFIVGVTFPSRLAQISGNSGMTKEFPSRASTRADTSFSSGVPASSDPNSQTSEALSPVEGITETVRSLENLFPIKKFLPEEDAAAEKKQGFFKNAARLALHLVADIGSGAQEIWQEMYAP